MIFMGFAVHWVTGKVPVTRGFAVDKVFRANGDLNTPGCSVKAAVFLNPWALFFETTLYFT